MKLDKRSEKDGGSKYMYSEKSGKQTTGIGPDGHGGQGHRCTTWFRSLQPENQSDRGKDTPATL